MNRRSVLQIGVGLVALGVLSVAYAFMTGIWGHTTWLVCNSAVETPFPPFALKGTEFVVYEKCNYTVVSQWLPIGILAVLGGGLVLGSERLTQTHSLR